MPRTVLFDSNILIYTLQKKNQYIELWEKYAKDMLCISSLTLFEVMNGTFTSSEASREALDFLTTFIVIDVSTEISVLASELFQARRNNNQLLKPTIDFIIEATALLKQIPVVTADKSGFLQAKAKGLLILE
ncbi:MAG: PIN domain-containing protein [bacterium]